MSLLDQFRNDPEGVGQGGRPAIRLAGVAAAGGAPAVRLAAPTRAFLWITMSVATLVAILHPIVSGWISDAGGGPLSLAFDALSWPHPVIQPLILGLVAATLAATAVASAGYRSVTTVTTRIAGGAGAVAVVAAAPFLLLVLAVAGLVALGVAVVVGILGLIIGAIANG